MFSVSPDIDIKKQIGAPATEFVHCAERLMNLYSMLCVDDREPNNCQCRHDASVLKYKRQRLKSSKSNVTLFQISQIVATQNEAHGHITLSGRHTITLPQAVHSFHLFLTPSTTTTNDNNLSYRRFGLLCLGRCRGRLNVF